MEDPNELLASIVTWARTDPRVDAVVQTGSRARGTRVDEFSDLDIELIGSGWRDLVDDQRWSAEFGRELVSIDTSSAEEPDHSGPEWATRLVVYAAGRKVDYTLAGPDRLHHLSSGLDDLYQRGYLVHLDKNGIASNLPEPTGAAPVPARPSHDEFDNAIREFWFEASQVPIYLARGDLWVAKFRDNTMKEFLLEMLQWYAATEPAGAPDIWHIGHRMDQWLPAGLWRELHEVYGHFVAEDGWRALRASARVFGWVSEEVARRCGFPSPSTLAAGVTEHLERIAGHGVTN
ncbi:aminoglycoside 6-adenylyltransferase [Tamaricihabitans halophyticus]|uniref:Aminoglycoside 6-adenylyltransferase n=1 Tax=Tamaricihabitans halophyticus TaxID=1262583 RepID=A0A4R2R2J6_9PSEU|nr:aminoglycoside 6-adenylyltransferase [Tamaricihabitans halophyticus]TCP56763.1 aminoglycoside 6-adenylyltransferase [Tamaricihabitans halophyticus]